MTNLEKRMLKRAMAKFESCYLCAGPVERDARDANRWPLWTAGDEGAYCMGCATGVDGTTGECLKDGCGDVTTDADLCVSCDEDAVYGAGR